MQIIISTSQAPWVEGECRPVDSAAEVKASGTVTSDFRGFGACFNELSWIALQAVDERSRESMIDKVFSPRGLDLHYNRLPIGASDFAESWYSHNETEGDFAMEHFSIEHDHVHLLPYFQAARRAHGRDFTLFASPWSPPTWLKDHKAYNFGRLVWKDEYRKAHALYLAKFVEAYKELGIGIDAVHVQNEPDSDQKFPSCCWTGERLRDFIRDDLGPIFEARGVDAQIWLGTIERASFNDWVAPTLLDPEARRRIGGAGFQWAGKNGVQRTRHAAPDLPLIMTENECGDGDNTWDYAHYVFDLAQHFLNNGVQAYVYWNVVLERGGISTWGWRQNSMFCVDTETGELIDNPEYHLMRHLAGFVREGAAVLQTTGRWASNAIMFRNADGSHVAVLQNPLNEECEVRVEISNTVWSAVLPPKSFATLTDRA
ncbi:glucosylceramidase [Rhizobium leguminosarum]|uniref:glycoside hydrolase family 30 protein n=1 Tax=Rhizobium leguminosarum TaxID=384 RepID=UPI0024B373A5|nr:glycosyl hydrolase [Rhizobium leguminosarum]WHO82743.1 glycosyl hydrolase [Rhizobium leguminosarum]